MKPSDPNTRVQYLLAEGDPATEILVEVWVETADVARAEAILRQHRDHLEAATHSDEKT